MSDQPIKGLRALFDQRLPINRKERYYTGTVLPMIVASDGFKRLDRFLQLCGVPADVLRGVDLDDNPESTNVQFFTEYGFKESLKDGAEDRFDDPGSNEAPDLVVYVESERSLLLGIEAKVFLRPSATEVTEQLQGQQALLKIMAKRVGTNPSIHQVALLPEGLKFPDKLNGVPVLPWERVADTFRNEAPPYWMGFLDEAIKRWKKLASSEDTYRRNADAIITGQDIYDRHDRKDTTFASMGRAGGLRGENVKSDIRTGGWREQKYEVRREGEPNQNWFAIADFIRMIAPDGSSP